ncbi:MAG: carotenoid 1,2-hydratase [Pseudomonadales bacterium]|nr:carotenoid 1,2-hydratase [Pseudomonadales bacterium]
MRRLCTALLVMLLGCGDHPATGRPGTPTIGGLRVGDVLGAADADGFAVADRVVPLRFPADHAQHPAFRSEWWYLTIAARDAQGQAMGVQFTLFRQGLEALSASGAQHRQPWQLDAVYLAHVAVTDVAAGTHEQRERLSRQHPSLAGVTADADVIEVFLEDWRLKLTGSGGSLALVADTLSMDLSFRATYPPVAQGEEGLSRKGDGQASYYYSWPALQVTGTLGSGAQARSITGVGWFDHEWSTSVLSAGQQGWDWLALHLDDGRALMTFRLRRADGARDPYDQGLLVSPAGVSRHLAAGDFAMQPRHWWRDEDGVAWPIGWHVTVDGESWTVRALVDDQRMRTLIPYWEGLVAVHDAAGADVGAGYLELTGYMQDDK